MKNKILKTVLLLATLVTFAFFGCFPQKTSTANSETSSSSGSEQPNETVVVSTINNGVEVEDIYLSEYDFTACFEITVNNEKIPVNKEYLDLSELKQQAGIYNVTCSYMGESANIKVTVTSNEYSLSLSVSEITVNKSVATTYDYNALFTATLNGKAVEITEDMVVTDLSNLPGTYTYKVTLGDKTQTLTVHVSSEHQITVAVSYKEYALAVSEIETFNYTALFSLFVDGKAVEVTEDMIDASELINAKVGDEREVHFEYVLETTSVRKSAKVIITSDSEVVINAKNVQTYPNGSAIDLTTLFTITKGDQNITVTPNMISGSVNYSVAGNNVITLNYEGKQATAVVEVVLGVVISYRTADTVVIQMGTDQSNYHFEKDFIVIINGVRFTIIEDYIDSTAVDFSKAGTYTATLTIPYNEKPFGLSGVRFDYITKDITYKVIENEYQLSVKEDLVTLSKGTTSYNPFRNINLTINGKNQTLTDNPSYVDAISCYAKLVSDPIDFNKIAIQQVVIEVYVNGPSSQPVTVEYQLIVENDITVTATNKVVFTGETLLPSDLFEIKEGEENIEVTFDMVTGKVDTFNPGVYYVTVNYQDLEKTSKVVVLNNNLKGTYKTNLYAIPGYSFDNDEETTKTRVGNMSVSESGEIVIKGVPATVIDAVDEKTLIINYRGNVNTLYYENGIIVIVPENEIKLNYYEEKRPLIYFNQDTWSIKRKTIVNSSTSYVLDTSYVCFSFDVFQLENKITGEEITYVFKIHLYSRLGTDSEYIVTWGEGKFAEGFLGYPNESSSITYEGQTYQFVMEDYETGKIPKADEAKKPFAGMTFYGTINGESAMLSADQYQAFALTVGGKKLFNASSYEQESMKNGGVNAETNEIFLYQGDMRNNAFYSYKFKVDPTTKTFEYVPHDNLFGYYQGENSYIFLDGYGTGFINYDSTSYYETQFYYNNLNNVITITYKDILPNFKNGTTAQFTLDVFGNKLIVHSGIALKLGEEYTNYCIQSGIIVNVNIETIGAAADSVAKAELYRAIEIITKDGVLTPEQLSTYVDTSTVRFSTPGFYRLSVKANVFGETVIAYYAIQVLEETMADSVLVKNYGAGVIYSQYSLTIDKYGRVILAVDEDIYVGSIKTDENNNFTSELYGTKGSCSFSGTFIANGLIRARVTGSINFVDYFTTAKTYIVGKDTTVLRAFQFADSTVYALSASESSATGEIVEVTLERGSGILAVGSIIKITGQNQVIYAKINELQNAKNGLVLSDGHRGSFEGENGTLTLDGFGRATLGTESGTYVTNGGYRVTVYTKEVAVYAINIENGTYVKLDISLDTTLVEGKTFFAEHYFTCDEYTYLATTTFTFLKGGIVKVTSVSSEHDSGDDKCYVDNYNPAFCSTSGTEGTFGVSGTKITVLVNGYTFVFDMPNVITADKLVCVNNGGLTSDSHGYFAVGLVFSK